MNYFAAIGMPAIVIIGPAAGLALNVLLNVVLLPALGNRRRGRRIQRRPMA